VNIVFGRARHDRPGRNCPDSQVIGARISRRERDIHVAIGHHPFQLTVVNDRQDAAVRLPHQVRGFCDGRLRRADADVLRHDVLNFHNGPSF
jgi:hypothetical protein